MGETTRHYLNQWIIKSNNAIEKAIFNMDRIIQAVLSQGKYDKITDYSIQTIADMIEVKKRLPILQSMFNDPRANKIDPIVQAAYETELI